MYVAVLLIHSWLRWAVLGLGLWVLVLCLRRLGADAQGSPRGERLHAIFLGVLDTQLLLGLLLYFWLSPISTAALGDLGAAMKEPQLRFFGVEHITAMLLAVGAAHAGRSRAKRGRYKAATIAQCLWLVLTLAAIPWPLLDVGRPLLRW